MNELYSYMSEFERYIYTIESVVSNKMNHLNYEFDRMMLEHEENLKKIETKVLMESGTSDDLYILYLAEAEETKEKGKGILSRIIGAVISFFKKIKSLFFKKDKTEDSFPDKLELSTDPKEIEKETNSIMQGIRSFLSGNKESLGKILSTAAVTTGAIVLSKKQLSQVYKNSEDYINKVLGETTKYQQQIENNKNMSSEDMNLLKKAINKVQGYGSKMMDILKVIDKHGTVDYQEIRDKNNEKKSNKPSRKEISEKEISQMISHNESRINELTQQNKKINELIEQFKKKKESVSKDNGGKSLIGNVLSARDQKELQRLEALGKKRSDAENEKYEKLQEKYGDHNRKKNRNIAQIDKSLEDLINLRNKNRQELDKRRQELDKLDKKGAHASINVDDSLDKSSSSSDIINKYENIINSMESVFSNDL